MNLWVRARVGERVVYGECQAEQQVRVWTDAPWGGGTATEETLAPGTYHLLAPTQPSKIVAVGRNYIDHAAEMKATVPVEPVIFLKPPTTVLPPGGEIDYPAQSRRVDYEGEMAVIIGQTVRRVTPEQAVAAIWGYTIANDVTARDLQKRDEQWTRSKGFDTFCPLGPGMVRELSPQAQIETWLNGERKQAASLQEMVFKPPVLVSYISQVMTLWPGDVILTGTPAGVGPMVPGDEVEVRITGIGSLVNRVKMT